MPRIGFVRAAVSISHFAALLALLYLCVAAVPAHAQDPAMRIELEIEAPDIVQNARMGNQIEIRLQLTADSAVRFARFTQRHAGKYLVLFSGETRVMRAKLMSPIRSGAIAINFPNSEEKAKRVFEQLERSGSKITAIVEESN